MEPVRSKFFSLGDVVFAVAQPVADRALVQAGQGGDMAFCALARNTPAAFADRDGDLALVIELF